MISTHAENIDANAGRDSARTILRIAIVQATVIVLGVIAAVSLGTHSVDARSESLDNVHGLDRHAHSDPVAAVSHEPADVAVWVAELTAERASGELVPFVGYWRDVQASEDRGTLAPDTFTYAGEQYAVQALVLRQRNFGNRTLIFKAERGIPDNLVLRIGDREFPVSESMVLGPRWNLHVWKFVEDLGWKDGDTATVSLTGPAADNMEPAPILPGSSD